MVQRVTFKDAAKIGIHGEGGAVEGVEEDGVGGFWTDAGEGQKIGRGRVFVGMAARRERSALAVAMRKLSRVWRRRALTEAQPAGRR